MVLAQKFPYYIADNNADTTKIICLPEYEDKTVELEVYYTGEHYSTIFIANFSESSMKIKFKQPFYGVPKDEPYYIASGENATFHYEKSPNLWFITH